MTRLLWLVGVVIAVAGLLFGYDQGVISGALRGIEHSFQVGTTAIEIITSWVTLGALIGALIAGQMADRLGRRPTILLAGALFTGGAIVEWAAPGTVVLVIGRVIVGVGVGVASVAAPLYAAEMAPTRLRGRFVSIYQLGITVGIFLAYLVDELLKNDQWRIMLGACAVVGIALILAILPLPDSVRWYLKMGRRRDAEAAIARVESGDPEVALAAMERDLAQDATQQASWGEVFSQRWRRPLLIGVGLAVFQQITGINAIIYYADKIFGAAGFHTPAEQMAATTFAVGAVNVLATLIAVFFVDRLGRKPLLLTGLVGMAISLTVVGIAFQQLGHVTVHSKGTGVNTSEAGIYTLVALVVYIASFAFSLGPVTWTMINEVFPRAIRGRAVSVATGVNWLAAWLVSQFFLTMTNDIGESGTFWVFAGLCVVAFLWIWRRVPETGGLTLEEIERMWTDGHAPSVRD